MPELPEVHAVVQGLRAHRLAGRRITRVWTDTPKILRGMSPTAFARVLRGARLEGFERRGKNVIILLDRGRALGIHQKMSGHLLVGRWRVRRGVVVPLAPPALRDPANRFIHLLVWLDNGQMIGLSDLRKFATVVVGSRESLLASPEIAGLGPDILSPALTAHKFFERIRRSRRTIKNVLLDQRVVSGLGNIYSDDALWQSRIHPFRRAAVITRPEAGRLLRASRIVLRRAVRLGGSSLPEFRDPRGRPGRYGPVRLAYQRHGEPCPRCRTPLVRAKFGMRSTHFCPQCQKK